MEINLPVAISESVESTHCDHLSIYTHSGALIVAIIELMIRPRKRGQLANRIALTDCILIQSRDDKTECVCALLSICESSIVLMLVL